MENLKYLNSAYNQASEKLKNQPAFKEILEEIEGEMNWAYSTNGARSELEVSDNSVKINLFFSYFGENAKTPENNSRAGILYEISLDNNQNVCYQKMKGDYIPKKIVINGQSQLYGSKVVDTYKIERNIYQKDTKNIIKRQQICPPMIIPREESNDTLDMPQRIPLSNSSYDYKNFDDEMKIQMRYRMSMIPNDLIRLNSTYYKNYTVWSAERNINEPEKATIREYIELPYNQGEIITKNYINEPVINMSNPSVMRIDPPYFADSYTLKQIEDIYEAKKDIYNQKEFEEVVQDIVSGRTTSTRRK